MITMRCFPEFRPGNDWVVALFPSLTCILHEGGPKNVKINNIQQFMAELSTVCKVQFVLFGQYAGETRFNEVNEYD